MKTIEMKKKVLAAAVMVVCSMSFMAQAQEKTYADKWAKQQTERYVHDLDLTEEQAVKVHEILLTTAKKTEEVRKTHTGEEQKKAIWKNTNERNKQLEAVFTREQQKKFKELKKKK